IKSALRDFDRAIALDLPGAKAPAAADDHVQKGILLQRDKRYDEALGAYDAALKINEANAPAHLGRAEVLVALKRRDEAAKAFARALKRRDEAAKAFDRYLALEAHPKAAVYRERARLRVELGNRAGAVADYTLALQLQPDAKTHAARGWVFLASEAYPLA